MYINIIIQNNNILRKGAIMKKILIFVGLLVAIGGYNSVSWANDDKKTQEVTSTEQTSSKETTESTTQETSMDKDLEKNGTDDSNVSQEINITESNNAEMGKEAQKNSEYLPFVSNRRSDLAVTPRISAFSNIETYIAANESTRPNISFIDISSHNGDLSVNDYNIMKQYGVKGVVVKLTEYTTYVNPYAKSQIENAKKAGLVVSAYHYSWFSTPAMAEAEADFFANQAAKLGLSKNTVMVNDAEQIDMTQGNVTTNSVVFRNRLNQLGYNRVAHYSMFDWFNRKVLDTDILGLQNSWVAQYPYNPLNTNLLHTNYAAWQWSSEVTFPNVNSGAGGRFDVNIAYSNLFLSANDSYDVIQYEKAVNFRAKVKTGMNHGIYNKVYNTEGNNPRLASSSAYEGKDVEVVKEAKTVRATWYQFKVNGKVIGWMDAQGFSNYDAIEYEKTVNFKAKVKTGMNHGIYNKVYNTESNNPRLASSSAYEGKDVEVVKEAKTVRATWYQFKVNGKVIGWMDAQGFSNYDAIEYEKTVNFKAKVKTGMNHGIYNKVYNTESNNPRLASSSAYEGKDVEVVKEAKTVRATWYQFKVNGELIGWMDAQGFSNYDAIEYEKTVNFKAKVKAGMNHGIYNKVYNTEGNNPRLASSSAYEGKDVEVVKEAKTVRATWYQFKVNGKMIGWMDAQGFSNYDAIEYEKTVNFKAKVKTGMNHGIYNKVYNTESNNPRLASSSAYEGKDVEVVKEAKTVRATWYQFKVNGKVIGWMDAQGFSNYDAIEYEKTVNFKAKVKTGMNHGIYNKVYNTESNNPRLASSSAYEGKDVEVVKEAKTVRATWYQFKVNDKVIGWMDAQGFDN
jgi:GH25 family lysozyme M1 (1,4-beta-N-acetylmuramidase)/membrane-bound acyltransferase YfiQ involved in biofilm formation